MKIWLPWLGFKSGASVYIRRLVPVLQELGHTVEVTPLSIHYQIFPYLLKRVSPSQTPDIVIADEISGAMFKGIGKKLLIIEHHCIFDPVYKPYRSLSQRAVHELLWRSVISKSLKSADLVICISQYTAFSVQQVFGELPVCVIPNAVETDFFYPEDKKNDRLSPPHSPVKLLYVGNLTGRKGVDLLPPIMAKLGHGYELRYTSGLKESNDLSQCNHAISLGFLTQEQLLQEFRRADIFLFPTRFEGFGYSIAEALACGIPVVSSRCSAVPEVVEDGVTGLLCPVNDVDCFIRSIKKIANDYLLRQQMALNARQVAVEKFSMDRWRTDWSMVLEKLL